MTRVAIAGRKIDVPAAPWSRRERDSWRWPDQVTPSQWAERYRVLYSGDADRQGPWRNENAPYLVGLMNLTAKRGVERLVCKKAAQVGFSEAARNVLGFWATQDPSPVGLVLPNKDKGTEIVENKIIPYFRRTPALARLFTDRAHDLKKGQLKLINGWIMHLMWSGSPASLASNPMKRAILDEVNKFEKWSGDEADPVSLTAKRLRAFADTLLWLISTPTTRFGAISQAFKSCRYQLYYLVPCPHCGTRQRLVYPQVKIPDAVRNLEDRDRAASLLIADQLAWYECIACQERLDERQKRRAVLAGRWGTVGEDLTTANAAANDVAAGLIADADAVPEFPTGSWVGTQISALNCMWESCTLSHIVAEHLRAGHDPARLMDFRNSTLGEDWEQRSETVSVSAFSVRSQNARLAEGKLPWWTDRVLATVDTQHSYFWLVVRAWGAEMRSQRVFHGRVESFADLDYWLFGHAWAYENDWLPPLTCDMTLIDTGGTGRREIVDVEQELASRTQEVYRWALQHRGRVRPIKGASRSRQTQEPFWVGTGVYKPTTAAGKPLPKQDLTLWIVDVNQMQDLLQEFVGEKVATPDPKTGEAVDSDRWMLNQRDDGQYNAHMSNLQKVRDREKGQMVERWVPIQDGARVDYRHCEGYQIAAAYMRGVQALPELGIWKRTVEERLAEAKREKPKGFTTPDGRPYSILDR